MRKVKFSRENREQTTQETLISVVFKITFKSIQDCISSENIVWIGGPEMGPDSASTDPGIT